MRGKSLISVVVPVCNGASALRDCAGQGPGDVSADRYEMAGYRAELRSQLLELQKHLWSTSDALHAHSVHLHDLRYILTRHRVAPELIEKRLRSAERGFLRQCLYRNGFHRWLTRLFGHDPASGWRQD